MIINKYIVDNKLIRGSKPGFRDVYKLKKEGVTQILCITSKRHLLERAACKLTGIKFVRHDKNALKYRFLNLDDFKTITSQIQNNKGKSFIHCHSGLHRTGECVAAYHILNGKKKPMQAITEDIFQKNYFEEKYSPSATLINKCDGIFTKFRKKHNNKIRIAIANSFRNFVGIFGG